MLDFIKTICRAIGKWIGLRPLYVGYIGLACIAVGIIAIILIAVSISKKKKRKASANAVESKAVAPIEEQTVTDATEEVAVLEEAEPVKEEQAIPVVEETSAPVVAEENKEETPAPVVAEVVEAEPVKEETPKEEKKSATKKPAAKKAPAKKEPVKKEEKPVEKVAKKLNGKWAVEIKSEGEYMAKLSASNGEVMLSSEIYTTEEGARNGISTIVKGIENGKFVIYQDKNKNFYYKLKTSGNRLLCVGEIYKSKDQCLKAVDTVKRIAKDSIINPKLVEGAKYVDYVPQEVEPLKKGIRGKWRVEQTDDGNYSAKLYASNGQLMLASEEVSLKKTAENAIESIKKNAAAGNFIIDHDKFGRFYYKLRNAQKSVICIGEAYEKLDSCTAAIESVRRFAATAVVEEKKA